MTKRGTTQIDDWKESESTLISSHEVANLKEWSEMPNSTPNCFNSLKKEESASFLERLLVKYKE